MSQLDVAVVSLLVLVVFAVRPLRDIYVSLPYRKRPATLSARVDTLDVLRGLAIIAVVLIHITFFYRHLYTENLDLANQLNNMLRFAVPFFFIISGILVRPLSNVYGWRELLSRKASQILLPYACCCLVLYLWSDLSPWDGFFLFLNGDFTVPYWFIPAFVQIFLLYPVMQAFESQRWFLPILFLFSYISHAVPGPLGIYGIPFVGRFLFMFGLGMRLRPWIAEGKFPTVPIKSMLCLIVLYGCVALSTGDRFYNGRLVYSVALFMLLFPLLGKLADGIIRSALSYIGKHTLWIYLTHFLIVGAVVHATFPLLDTLWFLPISIAALLLSLLYGILIDRGYQSTLAHIKKYAER